MKKFILIIIFVIIGILVGYFIITSDKFKTDNQDAAQNTSEKGSFKPNPSNATFIFDDGAVTLSEGKIERIVAPGNTLVEEIAVMDKLAYGDINNDKKDDTALLLARYGGGSGVFIYAAAFLSGPVNYKGSKVVFIGDRITPQSISIKDGTVIVNYLDRDPNEAFSAEPTIPMSKQFIYKNGEFQEK